MKIRGLWLTTSGVPRPKEAGGPRRRLSLLGVFLGLFLTTAGLAAGGEAHGGLNWTDFFWRTVNFLVLAGLLYRLVAKKAKDFFTGRRKAIADDLARAASLRQEARDAFQDHAARLERAASEIQEIARVISSQANVEKERLLADARRAAAKMREDARTRMGQEFQTAADRLRKETALMATEMAEGLLKRHLRPEDHEAMTRETIEKIAKASRNG